MNSFLLHTFEHIRALSPKEKGLGSKRNIPYLLLIVTTIEVTLLINLPENYSEDKHDHR